MRDLVVVGGGHAHVEVLRRFALEPIPGTRLTAVLDHPISVYSGMVPGVVAGRYAPEQVEIDAAALARHARARVVIARLTRLDAGARRLFLDRADPISYDVASLNLGSVTAGLERPGVAAHALPVRPMADFLRRIRESATCDGRVPRAVVVGGGAGGVELAFALRRRLPRGRISIVEASAALLPGAPTGLVRRVERRALVRGVELHLGRGVSAVEKGVLELSDGERMAFDVLVWAAGARGVSALAASGLPLDARGFVLVEATLQVVGQPHLFAAGDCAALRAFPETPKAGVHAVRQGPVLASNLRALLEGRPLGRFRPQRDFLTLLNLADGTAAGSKWGVSFEGRWVMTLKDHIDRRFVARYRSGAES